MSARRGEQGFSLVELLIAIVCTLFVSGAVLAMIVAGNNAFRREPALSDRQQNIRTAMDLIQKDISSAGAEMDRWVQAFMITAPEDLSVLDGKGPVGPDGVPSDHLIIIGNSGQCPTIPVQQPNTGVAVRPMRPLPACYGLPALVFLQGADPVISGPPHSVGFACDPTAPGILNFPSGQSSEHNFPGGGNLPNPTVSIAPMQVVRYKIQVDAPPLGDGQTPNLWRSPTGGVNPDGTCGIGGGGGGGTDGFQLVARGIEDLQVVYLPINAVPPGLPSPPVATRLNIATLVGQVEVTLVARALGEGVLHGETDPVGGPRPGFPRAVRQQLRSVTTPRAVLLGIGQNDPPDWR